MEHQHGPVVFPHSTVIGSATGFCLHIHGNDQWGTCSLRGSEPVNGGLTRATSPSGVKAANKMVLFVKGRPQASQLNHVSSHMYYFSATIYRNVGYFLSQLLLREDHLL